MIDRLPLGAPGIYEIPDEPLRALTGVRMDVCAFVGVAPRGPARVPVFDAWWAPKPCGEGQRITHSVAVPVESWNAYARLYGSFEGPGLLPYAVASFFENGGARAYIVRIVHEYVGADLAPDPDENARGVASAPFTDLLAADTSGGKQVWLRARNEGDWGNRLRATLSFRTRPLAISASAFDATGFAFPLGTELAPGTLLQLESSGGVHTLARIASTREVWHPETGVREGRAELAAPLFVAVTGAAVVEGELAINDGNGRTERHGRLGLSPEHPRWIAAVLVNDSQLVYPGEWQQWPEGDARRTWYDAGDLLVDPLRRYETEAFTGGTNRYRDITPNDFIDAAWVPGNECPGKGVHALVDLSDVALVVVPDLYSPRPLVERQSVADESGAGPEFAECVEPLGTEPPAPLPEDLDGLRLDPVADLEQIVSWQQKVVELADAIESFIVLLDIPPGLNQRRILYWRAKFNTAYAAAYHPWLTVARLDDKRDALVRVNPAAVAAGIIARREIDAGVQQGPANVLAAGAVDVVDHVSPARHDELHPQAINVYLRERDGVRLTAARTLSLDPSYRQLSVRRLVTMLRRVLDRQMQWAVFEPNTARLRADIRHMLEAYLRQLFHANAFTGTREEEAFFVRCDDELNPPAVVDQGRCIAEVGVAPAEPLEFIVLRIARDGDGTLRVRD